MAPHHPLFGSKKNEGLSEAVVQWQLNVTLICWLPLAQLTPFYLPLPQIIINLQILTPRYFTQVTPEMFENNICYVGSDLVQTQM